MRGEPGDGLRCMEGRISFFCLDAEDLVEIHRHTEGHEEETSDSRTDPIGWLKRGWSD